MILTLYIPYNALGCVWQYQDKLELCLKELLGDSQNQHASVKKIQIKSVMTMPTNIEIHCMQI